MISYVEIMNKKRAEEYALEKHTEQSVIISITSCGGFGAFIMPNRVSGVLDVLHLKFNDTDDTSDVSGGITDKDAISIRDFVNKHRDSENEVRLIVHCEAGQSRSAGVAAAIMKYLYNNDTIIFNNTRYTPNMLCYRKVLNKLFE